MRLEDNLEGYRELWVLENTLRELILQEMQSTGSREWLKELPLSAKESIDREFKQRSTNPFANPVLFQALCYVDFPDLATIIEQKKNWTGKFAKVFLRKESFIPALRKLERIRNALAHSRLISDADVAELHAFNQVLINLVGKENCQHFVESANTPLNLGHFLEHLSDLLVEINNAGSVAQLNLACEALLISLKSRELMLLSAKKPCDDIERLHESLSALQNTPVGLPLFLWDRRKRELQVADYAASVANWIAEMQQELRVHGK